MTFPYDLNFNNYIKNDDQKAYQSMYNLKGIVIHSGNS